MAAASLPDNGVEGPGSDKSARHVERLVQALVDVQRLDLLDGGGRHAVEADGLEFACRHVGHLVHEPSEQGFGIVYLARAEMRQVLRGEQDADTELPSLEQDLAEHFEVVLHDVVGFVDEEHRIDKAQLGIVTGVGTFLQVEYVFVVEVEEQDEEHVSLPVADPERGEVDHGDAGKEVVEVGGLGREIDEDLQVYEIGEDAVGRIDPIADHGLVLAQHIDQGRDVARGVLIALHHGGLEMVALPRPDASVDLLQGVVEELHAPEARRRGVIAGGAKVEDVEGDAVRGDDAGLHRVDEVRLRVVALVVKDEELRGVSPVELRAGCKPVYEGLGELRLAGSEIADDADVELVEPGVARMQVERLRGACPKAFADDEAQAERFGRAVRLRSTERAR